MVWTGHWTTERSSTSIASPTLWMHLTMTFRLENLVCLPFRVVESPAHSLLLCAVAFTPPTEQNRTKQHGFFACSKNPVCILTLAVASQFLETIKLASKCSIREANVRSILTKAFKNYDNDSKLGCLKAGDSSIYLFLNNSICPVINVTFLGYNLLSPPPPTISFHLLSSAEPNAVLIVFHSMCSSIQAQKTHLSFRRAKPLTSIERTTLCLKSCVPEL